MEIDRSIVEKLEMDVEDMIDVERANFDQTTFKLYIEIDDDCDQPPAHAEFYQVIQQWWVFRVMTITIA